MISALVRAQNLTMLKTAIQLKDAIGKIPGVIDSLGECFTIEREWLKDRNGEESSEEYSGSSAGDTAEQEAVVDSPEAVTPKMLNRMFRKLTADIAANNNKTASGMMEPEHLSKMILNVNIGDLSLLKCLSDITIDDLQQMYDKASEATFGNLKTMTTDIDPNVRVARDLSAQNGEFDVNTEMCTAIANMWRCAFNWSAELKVVPYKINLYKEGGKFEKHRDTPQKDLIGTFLLGIGDTSDGALIVYNSDESVNNKWESAKCGSWFGFYPDVLHKVQKLSRGIRGNIAFKVYGTSDSLIKYNITIPKTLKTDLPPFGIILTHEYSLETSSLKGNDRYYYDIFKSLGFTVKLLPALIKFEGESYGYRDPWTRSRVYPLTDKCLEYVLGNTTVVPKCGVSGLIFYGDSVGYEWHLDKTDYAERTGNECQPEEINSIYLHRIMIVSKEPLEWGNLE